MDGRCDSKEKQGGGAGHGREGSNAGKPDMEKKRFSRKENEKKRYMVKG